jgi:type IV pilus assembly protein PilN
MAKINLLPWRAGVRKQREREFYMMLGGAFVVGLLAVVMWVMWMGARIDNQERRNAYLTQQSKDLDAKLEEIKDLERDKAALLMRKQIIEKLQANRSQMVHLFDEMVKTIPDGARLSMLKQAGDTLTMEGVAQSNANVAGYMRNLDASPWLTRSDLQKTEAKANEKRDRFAFALTVKLTDPEAKAKAKAEAEAKKSGAAASPKDAGKPAAGGTAPAAPGANPTPPPPVRAPPSVTPGDQP